MKLKIEIEKVFGSGKLGLTTVRVFDGEGVIFYEITESNELVEKASHNTLDFALRVLGLTSNACQPSMFGGVL